MAQQTKGKCSFCENEYTGSGISKHLKSCKKRDQRIKSINKSKDEVSPLYTLRLKNAWNSDYWLIMEVNGNSKLSELDNYLRSIWLECCGHLSSFTPGSSEWGNEIPMHSPLKHVLNTEDSMTHIYDFGTSTKTMIDKVDLRRGAPLSEHHIQLIARNNPPQVECDECGREAKWLQTDYSIEFNEYQKPFCDQHLEEDEDKQTFRIVNSPRMGVCGYSGPSVAPY